MTEQEQLELVRRNGLALEQIEGGTPGVEMVAVEHTPRAIQFVANPSLALQEAAIRKGWNNLEYIENPSEEILRLAIEQSGWALKYISQPTEELQRLAVQKNYDAIKYIDQPSEAIQLLAVKENYQALRYIKEATLAVEIEAIKQDPQAMRLVNTLDVDKVLLFLQYNSLVIKYLPFTISLSLEKVEEALRKAVQREDIEERYIRDLLNCAAIDRGKAQYPIDKIRLLDQFGSWRAKQIAVDEKLTFK